MRIERVPLSSLSDHFKAIPAALAAGDPKILNRFAFNYQDERAFIEHAKKRRPIDPVVLAGLDAGSPRDKLGKGAVAVITGQQPSFLMGPLYNFYKAVSVVRISQWLESKGVPAVPVFWNHSDDDNPEGLDTVRVPGKTLAGRWGGGEVLYERTIDADVSSILPELKSFASGSLSGNFTGLLRSLFPEILVLEPRQLQGPAVDAVFDKALKHPIQGLIDAGGAALKAAGFDRALAGDFGTNVFAIEDGRRVRIDGPRKGRLIAGVGLRLILQDSVLPTAVYVGGPNELCYIAQLREVYEHFGLGPPAAMPRISATLIEPGVARSAEKLELGTKDLFQPAGSQRTLGALKRHQGLVTSIADLSKGIDLGMKEVVSQLEKADRQLLDLAAKTGEKLNQVSRAFGARIMESLGKLDEVAKAHAEKIAANVIPDGKLQERVYSPWHYTAMSPDLLKRLTAELDPLSNSHQVAWIGS